MNLEPMWSLAAIACSLAAIATLSLGWTIWLRAARVRETFLLLGSLVALAAHYGFAAVDAFINAGANPVRVWFPGTFASSGPGDDHFMYLYFTIWGALCQVCAVLFWTVLVLFLAAVVTSLNAPHKLNRRLSTWSAIPIVSLFSLAAIYRLVRCGIDLVSGAAPLVLQRDLTRAMHSGGTYLFVMPAMWLVNSLIDGLPEKDRPGSQFISLDLAGSHVPEISTVPTADFKALRAAGITGLLLIAVLILSSSPPWTHWTLGLETLLRILLLPSLMGLVFLKARYSFFDTVLKRGILFTVSAAVVIPAISFLLTLALPSAPGFTRTGLCVVATLLVWLSPNVFGSGDRWLDRVIFHRPDYRAELHSVFAEMARCPDTDSLAAAVTAALTRTLHAEFVEYGPEAVFPRQLVVRIGHPGQTRGYLSFGPRSRGQKYGSEDLSFADAVAAQFAGQLESFDARHSERLATAAELKALRAQINPHFLFNALNTLAEMTNGQPETERTILNLSRVFHYALDSTRRETVPLREEIAAVRAYLEIEKERFEDKLRFGFAVPDDVLDLPVPPMLIQPLVENAVKHGISPKLGEGTVRIAVARVAGCLRVTVGDDGVGFDATRITPHIGMANVRARVEKGGGTWSAKSRSGQGTEIVFELGTA